MTRTIVNVISTCAVACVALAAVGVAPAAADSVVFIRDHDVWLANPDGSGQYRVTFDGTASAPYESPSQAGDGTIAAIRRPPGRRSLLFRMSLSGGLLNPPTDAPAAGAPDADVRPDGELAQHTGALRLGGAGQLDLGPAAIDPGMRPLCGNPGTPITCARPWPRPRPCCVHARFEAAGARVSPAPERIRRPRA